MTINVCIAGATGWAGSALAMAVHQAQDLELVGAVSRKKERSGARGRPRVRRLPCRHFRVCGRDVGHALRRHGGITPDPMSPNRISFPP